MKKNKVRKKRQENIAIFICTAEPSFASYTFYAINTVTNNV
jgi:hypothetical protein